MRAFVIDTSAIVRLYVPDGAMAPGLEEAMAMAERAEAAILVPDLLLAEIGQVLLKKERAGAITADESEIILDAVLQLPLDIVGHRGLIQPATKLARVHGLSVYDALFLALASRQGATLLTCDSRLRAACTAIK